MITSFGHHGVTDYDEWKQLFDSFPPEHYEKFKITGTKIYRVANTNEVIVAHTFDTIQDAQTHAAMLDDPETKPMLEQGGVILPMKIWITEEVE